MDGKSQLQRMELFGRTHPFDGGDRSAIFHLLDLGHAGQGQLSVHQDRACPTMAVIAGDFGAGQHELLAQHIA